MTKKITQPSQAATPQLIKSFSFRPNGRHKLTLFIAFIRHVHLSFESVALLAQCERHRHPTSQ
jgi:hypothetical protein